MKEMIRNEGRQECDKRWWIRYKTNENDKAWEQKEDFDVKVMIGESESRRRRRKRKMDESEMRDSWHKWRGWDPARPTRGRSVSMRERER